jgi:mannose-6-phosphate isomerase
VLGLSEKKGGNEWMYAISNPYFAVIKCTVNEPFQEISDPEAFVVYTCVEGCFCVTSKNGTAALPVSRSVFIPAGLGAYEWQGQGILLKSFVPGKNN